VVLVVRDHLGDHDRVPGPLRVATLCRTHIRTRLADPGREVDRRIAGPRGRDDISRTRTRRGDFARAAAARRRTRWNAVDRARRPWL